MAPQHKFARARVAMIAAALATGGLVSTAVPQAANAVAPDQLVVTDVSNAGTQGLSPVSLRTLNVNGTKSLVKSVPLPTADAAGNVNAFTLSGDSNGNGALALSANTSGQQYLTMAGYHKVPGPTGITRGTTSIPDPKDTLATEIGRMVARISGVGETATVDTSTLLASPILSTSAPRGTASADGSQIYVSGNGGSDTPNSGTIRVNLGGASKVAINPTTQKNMRQIQIAGGNLYGTSDKGALFGWGKFASAGLPTGAPTVAVTQLGGPIVGTTLPTKDYVPDALLMLDANSAVAGIDTAYVVIDTDSSKSVAGEIRKYTTANGTSWTQASGVVAGDYPFLTGRVSGGTVQIFATKGSGTGNSLVEIDDTTATGAFTVAASPNDERTIATAAAGHAFRGVSLPPTGWDPGSGTNADPTISTDNSTIGGTLGDAHNPKQDVLLADSDSYPKDLTVTASSDNQAVLPNASITFTGTGLTQTATFVPAAKGRATVTFTVKDDKNNVGTTQVFYGASSTPPTATGHYLYESSDLSSAVDVGNNHTLAVSSEDSKIRLYDQTQSGRPVATFDMGGAGATGIGNDGGDLEGMTLVGNTLYVSGSHGNNSSGQLRPDRNVLFTATISGLDGANTTVTYSRKYTGLRDDLKAWDVANSNRFGFAAGQASGIPANDNNGFNIEGIEFAPNSTTTAYLGFRSPLVTKSGDSTKYALVVPVTNANVLSGAASGAAKFGTPIYLDLGGRTIRDIRKNSSSEYLITAQSDTTTPQWKLYSWDGKANHKPLDLTNLPDPASTTTGSWESVVKVPHPIAGSSVPLIADSGDSTYYGDATKATDESKGLQKSYTDNFAIGSFTDYPATPTNVQALSTASGQVDVNWGVVPGAVSYKVTVQHNGVDAPGSPKTVTAPTNLTSFTGLAAQAYKVTVSAANAAGESDDSAPAVDVVVPVTYANLTLPTISGNLTVGSTLTANDGTWDPSDGTYTYQWFAGGFPIGGQTAKTLDLTSDQANQVIRVDVTASKVGNFPATASSATTAAIGNGTISNVTPPVIDGIAREGQTLTANSDTWTPTGTTDSYEWSADGIVILTQTSKTLLLTSNEVGAAITVKVTASKLGYDDASKTSDPADVVDPADVTNTVTPSLPSGAAVDVELTVDVGTWKPATGVTFSYEWLADGAPIPTATDLPTFTPTGDELDKVITVKVTGSKSGLNDGVYTSNATDPVAAGAIVNTAAPILTGTAQEGKTLTVDSTGVWTHAPTSFTYKWFADGNEISLETGNTLDLKFAQVDKKITVEVTAVRTGYASATEASDPTSEVLAKAVRNVTVPSIPANATVGAQITVNEGTWNPAAPDTTFEYQWYAGASQIGGATSSTFTPTSAELGAALSVTVKGSSGGFDDSLPVSSNVTTEVAAGQVVNNSKPTIGGTAREGQTLTVTNDGTWTPSGITPSYVWKADGIVIGLETGNTLDLKSAQVGSVITVEVTAAKDGYATATKASDATGVVDPKDVTNDTLPSIGAAAVVGHQLTANPGIWKPATGVTFSYQWLLDGSPIALNGTGSTYTPITSEITHKISVKVTGKKSGLTDGEATSDETSDVVADVPPFDTPTKLGKIGSDATSITLGWTKSTDATHYSVTYGIGAGARTTKNVLDVSTLKVTGLKPGTAYTFDIKAFKADNTASAVSTPRFSASTDALTAPTDLAVSKRAGSSIFVTWTKVPGVTNYRITTRIGTSATHFTLLVGDVETAEITGLKHGQAYKIDIASLWTDKTLASPASPRISGSTSALLAPKSLKVTSVGSGSVTFSWTKSKGAATYRFSYGIGTAPRDHVGTSSNVSTFTVTGLTKGKKYGFTIAAIDADGVTRSDYSGKIYATPK